MQSPLKRIDVEKRSKLLLISIVSFFILAPLVEHARYGRLLLIFILYLTLAAAVMELAGKRALFLSAIPIAGTSMALLLASHFHPVPTLVLLSDLVLALFLLLVSVSMFAYLGDREKITTGRIYVSVTLYFLLALTWFAGYDLLNTIEPGSFAEGCVTLTGRTDWSRVLYFSMATLTTLGYGDVVPVRPAARMLATLEAAAGVLYIAITVARLVAAGQAPSQREKT